MQRVSGIGKSASAISLVAVLAVVLGACVSASGTPDAAQNPGQSPAQAEPEAGSQAASTPAIAPACKAPEYRQFDFWIGSWDVMVAGGKKAGDNKIEMINNGCALMESYSTSSGYRGRSFNIYDGTRKVWHQSWVDNSGLLLTIEGGMVDGSMVMTGTGPRATPQGDVLDRISWTPQADGSVRQVWETSTDEGETWKTIFDGNYQRKNN